MDSTTEGALIVRYDAPDEDGIARLDLQGSSSGFAGRSNAWFNVGDIASFARRLQDYPIDPANAPELSGGLGSRGGDFEEHVGLSIRPIGSLGQLGIEVRLRQSDPPDPPRPQHYATFEVRSSYEALRRFGRDLEAVIASRHGEARLAGEWLSGSARP